MLVEAMRDSADETDGEKLKQIARTKITDISKKLELVMSKNVSDRFYKELCDNVAGLGILEDFLNDSSITE